MALAFFIFCVQGTASCRFGQHREEKFRNSLCTELAVAFSFTFCPLLVIFLLLLLYLTHLLMASETDVYETQWVVG